MRPAWQPAADWAARIAVAATAVVSLAHTALLFPRFILTDPALPLRMRLLVGTLTLTTAAAVGGCLLALVLVRRSWHLSGARYLALFLAAVASVWGAALRLVVIEPAGDQLNVQLSTSGTLSTTALQLAVVLSVAAFLRFSATFPVTLHAAMFPRPRRFRLLRRARLALLGARTLWTVATVVFLVPFAVGFALRLGRAGLRAAGVDPDALLRTAPAELPLPLLILFGLALLLMVVQFLVLPVAGMLMGAANLLTGYRLADSQARRRVLWLVAGATMAVWMMTLPFLAGAILDKLMQGFEGSIAGKMLAGVSLVSLFCAPAVLVASAALAVFYSGAVDPRLVLQRSTVIALLGAIGFVTFATLESLLSAWFESSLNAPGLFGSVLAGCIAAAVLLPIRGVLGRAAARLLPPTPAAEVHADVTPSGRLHRFQAGGA